MKNLTSFELISNICHPKIFINLLGCITLVTYSRPCHDPPTDNVFLVTGCNVLRIESTRIRIFNSSWHLIRINHALVNIALLRVSYSGPRLPSYIRVDNRLLTNLLGVLELDFFLWDTTPRHFFVR